MTFAKSFEELRVTCQSQQGNTAPSAAFGPAFRFPSRLTPTLSRREREKKGGLLRKDSGHRWGNTNEEGASLILRLAGLEETGIGRLPAVPGVRRARADGISRSSIRDTKVPAS